MASLDCVAKVLTKHMDNVEKSKESVRAYKYDLAGTIQQRVWLAIELLYDNTGLKIDKISVSTFMDPDGIPDQDRFEEKTEEYSDSPYLRRLIDTINHDIKKDCV